MNRKRSRRGKTLNCSKRPKKLRSTKKRPTKGLKRTIRKARIRKQSNRLFSIKSKSTSRTKSTLHLSQTASKPIG